MLQDCNKRVANCDICVAGLQQDVAGLQHGKERNRERKKESSKERKKEKKKERVLYSILYYSIIHITTIHTADSQRTTRTRRWGRVERQPEEAWGGFAFGAVVVPAGSCWRPSGRLWRRAGLCLRWIRCARGA